MKDEMVGTQVQEWQSSSHQFFAIASAIGLRQVFEVHMKSTVPGGLMPPEQKASSTPLPSSD